MTITLNGEARAIESLRTLGDLLAQLGLAEKPVVVEHNKRALVPREIAATPVSDGDVIEIVQITAGG